jgi:hypothetical protein
MKDFRKKIKNKNWINKNKIIILYMK